MADLFHSLIRSPHNSRVKAASRLRDEAAVRREEGAYLAEGVKVVAEALAAGSLRTVFVAPRLREAAGGPALLSALRSAAVPVVAVADAVLTTLAHARTPQGVVGIVPLPAAGPAPPPARPGRPLLVAWRVQDPGNLGALARIVEATGAGGLAVAGGGADPYHPRAVRGAAGSLLRIHPWMAPTQPPLPGALQAAGYRLLAAVPRGGRPASRFRWSGAWALLLGGEGSGLPGELLAAAAAQVSVPTEGAVESLSVPAAAAMLLYEAQRQRRAGIRPGRRRQGARRPPPRRHRPEEPGEG